MEELNVKESPLERNLGKYIDFASWMIWYPDLFLDLITPSDSSFKLYLY